MGSPIIIAGAFTGIATLIVFVWWQLKTPNPMVDLRLFKNKVFKYSIITRYLAFMRSSATLFVLPIYLVAFRGWPEILASGVMLMMAIGMGIGAQVFGRLSDRYGVRPFMMGGFFFLVLTGIALATLNDTSNLIYIAVVVLINGLAMGAWSAPNASATMGSVSQSSYGLVSAIINLTRNLGNVSGQAVITAIIAGVMIARGFNIPLGELEDTPEAGFAFMDGWKYAYLAATGVVALAFITSFLTKPGKNESQAT